MRVEDETVWLTQKLLAALFDVDVRTVSEHLQNPFSSGEQAEASVFRKFRNTATDGKSWANSQRSIHPPPPALFTFHSLRSPYGCLPQPVSLRSAPPLHLRPPIHDPLQ